MNEREGIEKAIAALEKQRDFMDEATLDVSLSVLREKLESLKSENLQQRRFVTILFADLSGFTSRAERMDPEDLREYMNQYFSAVTPPILAHGGVIEKYIGDAVMAVFGLPRASEDDAVNALLAAFAIQEAVKELNRHLGPDDQFAVRIGVHTGPVLASYLGKKRKGEQVFTVIGDTVNTASRLEGLAPPGGILFSHETNKHTRGRVISRELPPKQIKGKSGKMRTYLLCGFRDDQDILDEEHLFPFIGREAELSILKAGLNTVIEDEGVQVITITGSPGIGKTRLLGEFSRKITDETRSLWIIKGNTVREQASRSFSLLRNLLSRFIGLATDRGTEVIRRRYHDWLTEFPGEKRDIDPQLRMLLQITGIDISDVPLFRREEKAISQAVRSARETFRALTRKAPVCILIDNLHWADEDSLRVLSESVSAIPDSPIFILAASRVSPPDDFWFHEHPWKLEYQLPALTEEEGTLFVKNLLHSVDQIPEVLIQMILSHAEGIPFYFEEFVRMLSEDEVIDTSRDVWEVRLQNLRKIRLPSTLQGILQVRMDLLKPVEKTVLQEASVIGRRFWDKALLSMNSMDKTGLAEEDILQSLKNLEEKNLIKVIKESTFPGSVEYRFYHSNLREAAYESTLKKVRKIFHDLCADWLKSHNYQGRGSLYGMLGHHLIEAGRLNEAVECLFEGGKSASEKYFIRESVNFFTRGLKLLSNSDGRTRCKILIERQKVYSILGDRVAQKKDIDEMVLLKDSCTGFIAEIAFAELNFHSASGNYFLTVDMAPGVLELAEQEGNGKVQAQCLSQWGSVLWRIGELGDAEKRFLECLALAKENNLPNIEAEALLHLGNTLWNSGDVVRIQSLYQRALALYRKTGDRVGECTTLNHLGTVKVYCGIYEKANTLFQEALDLARDTGLMRGECETLINLAGVFLKQGEFEKALSFTESGKDLAQILENEKLLASSNLFLGHIWGRLDLPEKALESYDSSLKILERISNENLLPEVLAGRSEVYLKTGQINEALRDAERISRFLEYSSLIGVEDRFFIYLSVYRVFTASGDERAEELLRDARILLLELSDRIPGEKDTFLWNIPSHRELLAEFERL
jgi:class 3 adenylate cyclase/tetratricopeptide (TPR) repeat protein